MFALPETVIHFNVYKSFRFFFDVDCLKHKDTFFFSFVTSFELDPARYNYELYDGTR